MPDGREASSPRIVHAQPANLALWLVVRPHHLRAEALPEPTLAAVTH